jgi:hypothetical protein
MPLQCGQHGRRKAQAPILAIPSEHRHPSVVRVAKEEWQHTYPIAAVADCCCLVFATAGLTFALEWRIRRREAAGMIETKLNGLGSSFTC